MDWDWGASSRSFIVLEAPCMHARCGILHGFCFETANELHEAVRHALVHDLVVGHLQLRADLDLRFPIERLTLMRRYTLHGSRHRSLRPCRLVVIVHGISSVPPLPYG